MTFCKHQLCEFIKWYPRHLRLLVLALMKVLRRNACGLRLLRIGQVPCSFEILYLIVFSPKPFVLLLFEQLFLRQWLLLLLLILPLFWQLLWLLLRFQLLLQLLRLLFLFIIELVLQLRRLFVFARLKKVGKALVVFVILGQQEQQQEVRLRQLFYFRQQQLISFSFQLTCELFLIQEQSLLPFDVLISTF